MTLGNHLRCLVSEINGVQMVDSVQAICALGPRWSSMPGNQAVRKHLQSLLTEAGVASVRAEDFPLRCYDPERAELEVLAPTPVVMRAEPLMYSPSTPPGGLVCDLFFGGDGTPDELRRRSTGEHSASGHAVLSVNRRSFLAYPWACEAGASAFVMGTTFPGGYVRCGPVGLDRKVGSIPALAVSYEDAQRLGSLAAEQQSLRVKLTVRGSISDLISQNVIATVPGTAPGLKRILVMAHHDSPWNGIHASDNATGLASLVALAGLAVRAHFRHTVEFLAFGGEELGFWGSEHYLGSRPQEAEQLVGVVSLDGMGSGRPGSEIGYTSTLEELVRREVAEMGFDVDRWSRPPRPVSDHIYFTEQGVPTFWVGGADENYHTPADVPERLNPGKLKAQTELAFRVLASLDSVND